MYVRGSSPALDGRKARSSPRRSRLGVTPSVGETGAIERSPPQLGATVGCGEKGCTDEGSSRTIGRGEKSCPDPRAASLTLD